LVSHATAIKIGTESHQDFHDVHFSNCTIRNSRTGIGIFVRDGATVERVTFSNISIENCKAVGRNHAVSRVYPIDIYIRKRNMDSSIGTIRDVQFSNIQITSGSGSRIVGMKESPIENFVLRDISIRVKNPDEYHPGRKSSYLMLKHVRDFITENLKIYVSEKDFRKYGRSALDLSSVANGSIRNVYRQPSGKGIKVPVIALNDAQRITISDCMNETGCQSFLNLTGPLSKDIFIYNNFLHAVDAVKIGADVPLHAVNQQSFKP
jgi:hypothetical protein